MNAWVFLAFAIGYLLGSIPFALVIGKVFYHKDIRTAGSGNLGGGNAGRVLGKKAGLAVMTLDILKVALAIGLSKLLPGGSLCLTAAGLGAAIGHCFPVFAGFRGGKAVATLYGFLFGMTLFGVLTPWAFFLPLAVFLLVLYLTKIIALASIASALAATLFMWISAGFSATVIALLIFDILIIWRHRGNLDRIRKGQENKISWM